MIQGWAQVICDILIKYGLLSIKFCAFVNVDWYYISPILMFQQPSAILMSNRRQDQNSYLIPKPSVCQDYVVSLTVIPSLGSLSKNVFTHIFFEVRVGL